MFNRGRYPTMNTRVATHAPSPTVPSRPCGTRSQHWLSQLSRGMAPPQIRPSNNPVPSFLSTISESPDYNTNIYQLAPTCTVPTTVKHINVFDDRLSKWRIFSWAAFPMKEECWRYLPVIIRDQDVRYVSKTMFQLTFSWNIASMFRFDNPVMAVRASPAESGLLNFINSEVLQNSLTSQVPFTKWDDSLLLLDDLVSRMRSNIPGQVTATSKENSPTIAPQAVKSHQQNPNELCRQAFGWMQIGDMYVPFIRPYPCTESVMRQQPFGIPFAAAAAGLFIPVEFLLRYCTTFESPQLQKHLRVCSIPGRTYDLEHIWEMIQNAAGRHEVSKDFVGTHLLPVQIMMALVPKLYIRIGLPHLNNERSMASHLYGEITNMRGGILKCSHCYTPFLYSSDGIGGNQDWTPVMSLSLDSMWIPLSMWACCKSAQPRCISPVEIEFFALLSIYFSAVIKPVAANDLLICARSVATGSPAFLHHHALFLSAFQQRQANVVLERLSQIFANHASETASVGGFLNVEKGATDTDAVDLSRAVTKRTLAMNVPATSATSHGIEQGNQQVLIFAPSLPQNGGLKVRPASSRRQGNLLPRMNSGSRCVERVVTRINNAEINGMPNRYSLARATVRLFRFAFLVGLNPGDKIDDVVRQKLFGVMSSNQPFEIMPICVRGKRLIAIRANATADPRIPLEELHSMFVRSLHINVVRSVCSDYLTKLSRNELAFLRKFKLTRRGDSSYCVQLGSVGHLLDELSSYHRRDAINTGNIATLTAVGDECNGQSVYDQQRESSSSVSSGMNLKNGNIGCSNNYSQGSVTKSRRTAAINSEFRTSAVLVRRSRRRVPPSRNGEESPTDVIAHKRQLPRTVSSSSAEDLNMNEPESRECSSPVQTFPHYS